MTYPTWILAHGEDVQFALFFSLLLLLAALEWVVPRRRGPMARMTRWRANGILTAMNIVTLTLMPIGLISAALWAQSHRLGLLNWSSLPLVPLVLVNALARSFISFFSHYLNHMVPMFWRVHRVHHLDTELDVTSTVRQHPLEAVIGLLSGLPLVVAFGLTPWLLVSYECLDVVVTLWSHSNIRIPPALDRIIRYLVVTPDLHRIHHSTLRAETNSNYGAVFPLWDLVFGTFVASPRVPHEDMRLGLDEVRGMDAHRPVWLLSSVVEAHIGRPETTLLPPALLLVALMATATIGALLPGPGILTPPWNLTGIVLIGAGVLLNIAGDRRFKDAKTAMSPWRPPSAIVTSGPFRYSRNPMYLGMVLVVAGAAVVTNGLTVLAIPLGLAVVLQTRFIDHEERAMATRFGDDYANYRARVRRWI
jgi:sterol desaturase/sphingolipid hydroxylase (fatty acid hydroxylase superfamily)/protein-S-isoprenylcysteine O-methyltransferase Ste14